MNSLLLSNCELLTFHRRGQKIGSIGLVRWEAPGSNECSEVGEIEVEEGRFVDPVDNAWKCARVCAAIAFLGGAVLSFFGFMKQCVIPLPCSQRIIDLMTTVVTIALALVYVIWMTDICDFYSCQYGDGGTYLIVTQILWLGAGCFTRCMRDGRYERRDEIRAEKERKREEKERKRKEEEHEREEEEELERKKAGADVEKA